MDEPRSDFRRELEARGVSRREFMGFCSAMAVMFGLPKGATAMIADAIENKPKPTLVWLNFQDCAGNTESFLRASRPTVADILLDTISVDYHETIMAAAGHQAERSLHEAIERDHGRYIAVVEGSIPTEAGSVVAGDGALDVANAETLTVTYLDADDGTGSPATKQATAVTDCASPTISNVASADVTGLAATVSFDSDEPTTSSVNYGTSCGSLTQSSSGSGTLTTHDIALAGLTPSTQYFFSVVATDAAGNVGPIATHEFTVETI